MKKFLSIFVAVAMVFSLFAGTFAPRALAANGVTGVHDIITDTTKLVEFSTTSYRGGLDGFDPLPGYTWTAGEGAGTLGYKNAYVYKMGDIINGTLELPSSTAGHTIYVGLFQVDAVLGGTYPPTNPAVNTATLVQTITSASATTYAFQLGTGNVRFDGPYKIAYWQEDATAWTYIGAPDADLYGETPVVYIMYNLTWNVSAIPNCKTGNVKIDGWIRRGFGTSVLVPVNVLITYPTDKARLVGGQTGYRLANQYTVNISSSGQFTLTFAVDPANVTGGLVEGDWIGEFQVFLQDGYPTAGSAYIADATLDPTIPGELFTDALVYDTLNNTPENIGLTASTYISPVLLYQNVHDQPLLLQLTDQNGALVSGATWVVGFGAAPATPITPTQWSGSPGFYHFTLDIASAVDVRLMATKTIYGSSEDSNTLILNTRTLGAFNPYIDVRGGVVQRDLQREWDCKLQRYVYATLPCTIGDAIYLKADYWEPIDPDNWYMEDFSATVNGPVRDLDMTTSAFAYDYNSWFIIEKAGKISVSLSATMWEKVIQDGTCYDWFTGTGWSGGHFTGSWNDDAAYGWDMMSENACCHTYEKTFDVCEVVSCALVGVTVENGQQTTATSIEVYKKADLVVNVSGASAPANLSCGCNTKIVHIYMTKCPSTGTTGMLPYEADDVAVFTVDTYGGGTEDVNELWYNGTGSSLFPATTADAIVVDNCEKLTFKGVTFNYVNESGNPCGYRLVVEVYGLERNIDACGNMVVTYPRISNTLNNITITPAVVTKTVTDIITEMGIDPEDILAGVPAIIDITDPAFTATGYRGVAWTAKLNGVSTTLLDYHVHMLSSATDTGYRFSFDCAFSEAGTLVIVGTNWSSYCDKKEVVTITNKVVMPAFEVKIGLADGSIIANDHIVTEGFKEYLYVTATDPRPDGHHDFATDTNWKLDVEAVYNDCNLPTSFVCGSSFENGCTTPSPIGVVGYDNPNIEDAPQFDLHFVVGNCAHLLVDTFTLVAPTVSVSPTEVPFTIPASATHVVFTVKDAHAHGAPDVEVMIEGATIGTAGASGYNFVAGSAYTDANGEADWAFVPPYSGKYYVYVHEGIDTCAPYHGTTPYYYHMCGWDNSLPDATITAKYQAPVVDTTAPVVTITTGIDGSKVASSTLNLTGKVTDNVGVTQLFVGFNKVDVLPDGSFMAALKLVEGENTIAVVAYDAAGNKGTATAKVTYTAPVDTSIVLVLTIGADIVSVNGKATSIDAAPEIVASRTFVPIRFIAESFGATVEWLPETQGITITLGDHTVGLQIGNATAVVDGTIISLPAAPYIKSGRTMVPLRLISEAFGGDVVWDAATRTITITYQP
jgi:hypothetical protein